MSKWTWAASLAAVAVLALASVRTLDGAEALAVGMGMRLHGYIRTESTPRVWTRAVRKGDGRTYLYVEVE